MAVIAAAAIAAVAAGGAAYYSNQQANKRQNQLLGAQPNGVRDYLAGVKIDKKYAPQFAAQNYQLSSQYSPLYADMAASIYGKQAPKIAATNYSILGNIDPESIYGRKDLYSHVSHDLGLGTGIDPQLLMENEQAIRGAQAARGNVLGNAPVTAEAIYTGAARQNLYQQRLDNMRSFLAGPTPESHFSELLGGGAPAVSAGTQSVYQPYSTAASGAQSGSTVAGLKQRDYNNFASALAPANQVNPWAAATANLAGSATQYLNGRATQAQYPKTTIYGGTYEGTMGGNPVYRPQAPAGYTWDPNMQT